MKPLSPAPAGQPEINRPASSSASVASDSRSRMSNVTIAGGSRSTEFSEPLETKRKPPQHAFVPREVRAAVVAGLRIHREGIQRVSKRLGLSYNESVEIFIEEAEAEKRREFHRGYLTGLSRGVLPPNGPGLRRAA